MHTSVNSPGGGPEILLDHPVICLETIGRYLDHWAPEPWSEITIAFTIIEIDDVCEWIITYKPRGLMRWRMKQFNVSDTNFSACFYSLAKLTQRPGEGLFKSCRYVLAADGKYKVDFEY